MSYTQNNAVNVACNFIPDQPGSGWRNEASNAACSMQHQLAAQRDLVEGRRPALSRMVDEDHRQNESPLEAVNCLVALVAEPAALRFQLRYLLIAPLHGARIVPWGLCRVKMEVGDNRCIYS
jgi:hypothetical protein